jgi:hypothetical protein
LYPEWILLFCSGLDVAWVAYFVLLTSLDFGVEIH